MCVCVCSMLTDPNLLPFSRNDDKFEQVFANDTSDVLQNLLDFHLPMNFLIHGYIDSFHGGFRKTGFIGWQDTMARELAIRTQANVCAVDWSRLASYVYTIAALSHTHKVADHITEFIRVLEANGADIGQMTIFGHSLGAQTAAYVGANLAGKLKAIYGFDPAGPGFSFPFSTSPANVLDPTDAQYVQCIHTARMSFGINYNCGHADFYPNTGFKMPGCTLPICSHLYAVSIFRSSINPEHSFVGTHCDSDREAKKKGYQCSSIQESMGIYNKGIKGMFYMYTAPAEPYCLNCKESESIETLKVPTARMNPLRHRPQISAPMPSIQAEPTAQDTSIPVDAAKSSTSFSPIRKPSLFGWGKKKSQPATAATPIPDISLPASPAPNPYLNSNMPNNIPMTPAMLTVTA